MDHWVPWFGGRDSDAAGMCLVPPGHGGGLVNPGEAIVVDRGVTSPDGLFAWSTSSPEVVRPLVGDSGPLVDGVGVTVTADAIYVSDRNDGAPGRLYRLDAIDTLVPLELDAPIAAPGPMCVDPRTGELIVTDGAPARAGRIFTVDPRTGAVGVIATDLDRAREWSTVDTPADGRTMIVSAPGMGLVLVLERAAVASVP